MGARERYRQSESTAARIVEGLAFVITPHDNKLHTLNRTATAVWELAEAGCTIDEAADLLTAQFRVDVGAAAHDVQACFRDLVERGILTQEPAQS